MRKNWAGQARPLPVVMIRISQNVVRCFRSPVGRTD